MGYIEVLMEVDIEFGKTVWHTLRASEKFPFQGIFWLLNESGIWHLMIATPKADTWNAYEDLAEITKDIVGETNQFKIELISPNHPFYQALRSVYGQKESVEGIRLNNGQIWGMYIEAAYLYEIR